jgi:MGT family glycosyltransferase
VTGTGRVRSIVVFTPGGGHAERLLPLVTLLAERGYAVHVMTRPEVGPHVLHAGGRFHDLFAEFPLDAVDRESIPLPSRFVTHAAKYLHAITAKAAGLSPQLVVYDSFMVVAPLVAARLGVPAVGMRAGHAQIPSEAIAAIEGDPRVRISPACQEAVRCLRDEHGLADASPFSYLANVSSSLNLYPEPAQYVGDDVRAAFAPLAFFGSLAPAEREQRSTAAEYPPDGGGARVYVSFGTVIWRYFADAACAALAVISKALSERGARTLVSLGGYAARAAQQAALKHPGVQIERFVDQWQALKSADVFITHHGLNSTHESVFHRVPMLSFPFFGDQPALAARCHALQLALPLGHHGGDALTVGAVHHGLDRLAANGAGMRARLAEARQWELDTIDARRAVVDRMLAL